MADAATLERAGTAGLDAVRAHRDNDSNGFFTKLGDQIYTGPTGTDVNGIFVAIREY